MADPAGESSQGAPARHFAVGVLRFILSGLVAVSLPGAHLRWGPDPGAAGIDGPAAFGFLIFFTLIGAMGGAAVFAVGTVHHLCRPGRLKSVIVTDVVVAAVAVAAFAYMGVTAEYRTAD